MLLLEHNVINNNEIKKFVAQFALRAHNPNIVSWINSKLPKYMENSDEYNIVIDPSSYENPPAWLPSAVERGDEIRKFDPPHHLHGILEHLVDYLNALVELEPRFVSDPRRLNAMTVEAALARAQQWVQFSNKKEAKKGPGKYETVHKYSNGFYLMTTTDIETVHRDGSILSNCLGRGHYDDEISSGSMKIYFLRDEKHSPHVAMSIITGDHVQEIKGKQNEPPVEKYASMVVEFLNNIGLVQDNNDLRAMGYVVSNGKIVSRLELSSKIFEEGSVTIWSIPDGDNRTEIFVKDGIETVGRLFINNNTISYITKDWKEGSDAISTVSKWATQSELKPIYGLELPMSYDYRTKRFGGDIEVCTLLGENTGTYLYENVVKEDGTSLLKVIYNNETQAILAHNNANSLRATIPDDCELKTIENHLVKIGKFLPKEYVLISDNYVNKYLIEYDDSGVQLLKDSDGEFKKLSEMPVIWKYENLKATKWVGSETIGSFYGFFVGGEMIYTINTSSKQTDGDYNKTIEHYGFRDFIIKNPDIFPLYGDSGVYLGLGIDENDNIVVKENIEKNIADFGNNSKVTVYPYFRGAQGGTRYSITYIENGRKTFEAEANKIKDTYLIKSIFKIYNQPKNMDNILKIGDNNAIYSTKISEDYVANTLGLTRLYSDERRLITSCNKYLSTDKTESYRLGRRIYVLDKDENYLSDFVITDQVADIDFPSKKPDFYSMLPELSSERNIKCAITEQKDQYTIGSLWRNGIGLTDDNRFYRLSDKFSTKKITHFKQNGKTISWIKKPYIISSSDSDTNNPPNDHTYGLYDSDGDLISPKYVVRPYGNGLQTTVGDFKNNPLVLCALMNKIDTKLKASDAARNGIFRSPSGKYKPIIEGTQLHNFTEGKISFADGTTMRISSPKGYGIGRWYLIDDEGDEIATIEINDDGIESVKYHKHAKLKPASIMKHIKVLMDCLEKLS